MKEKSAKVPAGADEILERAVWMASGLTAGLAAHYTVAWIASVKGQPDLVWIGHSAIALAVSVALVLAWKLAEMLLNVELPLLSWIGAALAGGDKKR